MLRVLVNVQIEDDKGNVSAGVKGRILSDVHEEAEFTIKVMAGEAFRDAAYAGSLFDFKREF
jgi:hypothetical protein